MRINSLGVDISIAGGVEEMVGTYLLVSFFFSSLSFSFLTPFLYLFKVQW